MDCPSYKMVIFPLNMVDFHSFFLTLTRPGNHHSRSDIFDSHPRMSRSLPQPRCWESPKTRWSRCGSWWFWPPLGREKLFGWFMGNSDGKIRPCLMGKPWENHGKTMGKWVRNRFFFQKQLGMEFHHPNWRSPSFFREVGWNHQPVFDGHLIGNSDRKIHHFWWENTRTKWQFSIVIKSG